ncbi:hypothetical protein BV502_15305 [Leucobacter sp. OAMLP11]|uniref:Ig-like domain-containing protein n=2 Tax=Leucobacter TaxID=55968 RepID=UPI000C1903CD|nr:MULTISPECIES: Ig-like domain-containing protein [unclassified Leucobacter]PIO50217.1 hypothetical protein BV502_15305 [Leucobacter sp. OAMLP11]
MRATVHRRTRRGTKAGSALACAFAAAAAATAWAGAAAPAQAAQPAPVVLTSPGSHTVVVPAGAQSVRVVAQGGSGAKAYPHVSPTPGAGARVFAELPVVPGETLVAVVGGNAEGSTGGANGGASGTRSEASTVVHGGGGGGATDLRRGGSTLADRVLVAGGGGGTSGLAGTNGGSAGALTGGAGSTAGGCAGDAGGGTPTGGGAPGAPCIGAIGSPGLLGSGGAPGFYDSTNNMGGGGGGGLYGGGGGSPWGGGGAGSSFAAANATNVSLSTGPLGATPSMELEFTFQAASRIALALSAGTVVADGTSTVAATATVSDADGNPIAGEDVVFESSDSGQRIGDTVDHGDGTYSAEIRVSSSVALTTISARDRSVDPAIVATAPLRQGPGPVTEIGGEMMPDRLVADGSSTTGVELYAFDTFGHRVPGQRITVEASDPGVGIGEVRHREDGSYRVRITASKRAGEVQLTAIDRSVSPEVRRSFTLTLLPGAPVSAQLSLDPGTIVADGKSTTRFRADVSDANGNPVPGLELDLRSSDHGQFIGGITETGPGTYAATVRSSTAAGRSTLTLSIPQETEEPETPLERASALDTPIAAPDAVLGTVELVQRAPAVGPIDPTDPTEPVPPGAGDAPDPSAGGRGRTLATTGGASEAGTAALAAVLLGLGGGTMLVLRRRVAP